MDKVGVCLPVNGVSDPITTSDGTVIVRVVERDEVTPEEFRKAKETFRAELLNERRGRFFSAYMTKAKEKIDDRDQQRRRAARRGAVSALEGRWQGSRAGAQSAHPIPS